NYLFSNCGNSTAIGSQPLFPVLVRRVDCAMRSSPPRTRFFHVSELSTGRERPSIFARRHARLCRKVAMYLSKSCRRWNSVVCWIFVFMVSVVAPSQSVAQDQSLQKAAAAKPDQRSDPAGAQLDSTTKPTQ